MLDVRIVLDEVPEYIFKACGAQTQDERAAAALLRRAGWTVRPPEGRQE